MNRWIGLLCVMAFLFILGGILWVVDCFSKAWKGVAQYPRGEEWDD